VLNLFLLLFTHVQVRRRVARVLGRGPRLQKKLGEVVYKGHDSYQLMVALQLGIRHTVGRIERPRTARDSGAVEPRGAAGRASKGMAAAELKELMKETVKITFPSCGRWV
jgi:hypothetical protein